MGDVGGHGRFAGHGAGHRVRNGRIRGAAAPRARGAPGAVSTGATGATWNVYYTATDGSVWHENVTSGQTTPVPDGGHLISAPLPIWTGGPPSAGPDYIVFGQGRDNALWEKVGSGPWTSLGGTITSRPGAEAQNAVQYSVYARGTDGAVWARDHISSSGWGPWHRIGGQVLPGTGPTAAFLGSTYVLVVGTNNELYLQQVGMTGFVPVGGATTASPALTDIQGVLVGFARGTDNAGYYHRFLSSSPGWHTMGGRFTSGLAAASAVENSVDVTRTFGLGTNSQIYEMAGSWSGYPPGLGTWVPVTG